MEPATRQLLWAAVLLVLLGGTAGAPLPLNWVTLEFGGTIGGTSMFGAMPQTVPVMTRVLGLTTNRYTTDTRGFMVFGMSFYFEAPARPHQRRRLDHALG